MSRLNRLNSYIIYKVNMANKKEKKPDYKAHLFSFKYLLFDIIKWLGFWQALIWWRPNVKYDGQEAKQKIRGGAVISSNHISFADPFILQCSVLYRRWHFLFMKDLIKNKFQEWMYRHAFLSFPIDRDAPSLKTMRFLSEYVKGGNLLALFPEGHIKRDGVIDDFKGGAILIAYLSDAPIIPIYHQKRKNIWHMTRLVIGKPINVKERIGPTINQEKIKELANELYEYELQLKALCGKEKKNENAIS